MNTPTPEQPVPSPAIEPSPLPEPHEKRKPGPRWAALKLQGYNLLRKPDWKTGVLILAGVLSVPAWRSVTSHAKPAPVAQALTQEFPSVAVACVAREDLYNELPLYAEFRPYQQVDLHAKVSGFLEEIKVDIGDRVKAGQLLARLEVPELRNELDQAQATLLRAQADYTNAHLFYTRTLAVDKDVPNSVSQQELDSAEAKDRTMLAAIAAAKADAEKFQTLLGYTRITAPFDGVITHRFADPGALIQAGTASDTQSLPLVCVSDNYRLRLDFPVSVVNVKDIQVGALLDVRVDALPGKIIKGKISRCTQKVDEATRTMTTEIEVPNPDLELVPGMYATVVLRVSDHQNALAIPTEAVAAGEKSVVYVINSKQEIEERPVTLGVETPTKFEVTSGLKEGDLVLIGNRSQIKPGQKVVAKLIGSLARQ